jgi:hypothetical protein
MLWDYLKTLITLRLTLQAPCMCAGCAATLAAAKGRLIRRTVPGSTPNCLAMTRTRGHQWPGSRRA